MSFTAVVFGATGLVGRDLIAELLKDDRFTRIKPVIRTLIPVTNPKLDQLVWHDFDKIGELARQLTGEVYFCCIGTTIKKAGSRSGFTKVDLDIPVSIASLAESLKIPCLVVVSSVGANPSSPNFYLRTKGEMEAKVREVYHGNLKILRPSMLLGKRPEVRPGEWVAQSLFKMAGFVMIGPLAKFKGIESRTVARGMIRSMGLPSDRVLIESHEITALVR